MEDASLVRLARGLLCVTTLEVVRAGRVSNNSRRRRVKPDPDRARHAQDRVEARIAVLAERLVQTLAAEARLLGDLAHADGAGDVTERARDAGRVFKTREAVAPHDAPASGCRFHEARTTAAWR